STSQNISPRSTKFYSSASHAPQPFVHNHIPTPPENAAIRLRDMQKRFLEGTTAWTRNDDGNMSIEVVGLDRLDRRTVIDIYDQALAALSRAPSKYDQIVAECTSKTRVVLGIITAEPEDPIFMMPGQLLKPLDPQYAKLRIERGDDEYGYRAQYRLTAWRKDGWPEMYPVNAIRKETEEKNEKLVGKNCITDRYILTKMLGDTKRWDDGDIHS
ncbi:hypothetical protein DE146DRAFT_598640, partial [Phaeosphaeria sp. MPI-PUGE-AT-0046c]